MKIRFHACQLLAGAIALIAFSGSAQLINGNFATGDFTGWTLFGINNGGTSYDQVTPFDITGTGNPVNCAGFEVSYVGAGLYQNVSLGAGPLNLSVDIAATSEGNNADAGTFELQIDGTTVASDAMGYIGVGQTYRSSLDYTATIAAGTYQIGVEMVRGYGSEYPNTPFEYLGNFDLSATPVPEPSSVSICGAALMAVVLFRQVARFRRATRMKRVKVVRRSNIDRH